MTTIGPLRLALFDIDGTLRRVDDPWLHLHRLLGTAAQGGEFYESFLRGDISYVEMARRDVDAWKGVSRSEMLVALESNPVREGARELVEWLARRDVPSRGISTGISVFNDVTARELGLASVLCNEIGFADETCDGTVVINLEEDGKAAAAEDRFLRDGVGWANTVAFGDSDADIPLLERAALGVAVFPRNDKVRRAADLIVDEEPINSVCAEIERRFGLAEK